LPPRRRMRPSIRCHFAARPKRAVCCVVALSRVSDDLLTEYRHPSILSSYCHEVDALPARLWLVFSLCSLCSHASPQDDRLQRTACGSRGCHICVMKTFQVETDQMGRHWVRACGSDGQLRLLGPFATGADAQTCADDHTVAIAASDYWASAWTALSTNGRSPV
jgi:hypothetical protein